MRDQILQALARCALGRPRLVLACAVILAAASAVYAALSLRMNANTDDLIDADRPYMQDYRAFLDEFCATLNPLAASQRKLGSDTARPKEEDTKACASLHART